MRWGLGCEEREVDGLELVGGLGMEVEGGEVVEGLLEEVVRAEEERGEVGSVLAWDSRGKRLEDGGVVELGACWKAGVARRGGETRRD